MRFTDTRLDGRTVANVRGAGEATIIFVHGFGCGGSDWDAQMSALAADHRVIAYDLPGHGGSGPPPEVSVGHLARDLCALRRRFTADPCLVVGHSMGCRVAIESYRLDPAGVAGLVLVDGSRIGESGDIDQVGVVRSQIETIGGAGLLRSLYAGMIVDDGDFLRHATERLAGISPADVEDILLSLAAWDKGAAEVLSQVRVPLLLIQSSYLDLIEGRRSLTQDDNSPWLEFVATHAPHAEVEIIAGTLHFPHVEKALEVTRAIERFAAKTLRPGAPG